MKKAFLQIIGGLNLLYCLYISMEKISYPLKLLFGHFMGNTTIGLPEVL